MRPEDEKPNFIVEPVTYKGRACAIIDAAILANLYLAGEVMHATLDSDAPIDALVEAQQVVKSDGGLQDLRWALEATVEVAEAYARGDLEA